MNLPEFNPQPLPKAGWKRMKELRKEQLRKREKFSKKPVGRPNFISTQEVVSLIEDYFANEFSIRGLAKKYNVSEYSANRYVSRCFFKKLSDETEVVVRYSKVS